jgi:hypothetical protein
MVEKAMLPMPMIRALVSEVSPVERPPHSMMMPFGEEKPAMKCARGGSWGMGCTP